MNYIFLLLIIVGLSMQNVAKKGYNSKISGGAFIFAAVSTMVSGLLFVIRGISDFNFQTGFIIYSVLFAVSYAVCTVCSFFAIQYGSLALTSLAVSYSLIIPTFFGIFFLNEDADINLYVGLSFLAISLFLINWKREENSEKKQITLKWGIYTFLAFLGNGVCTTVQNLQQTAFSGNGKDEFMSIAMFSAAICFALITLKTEKTIAKDCIKKGFGWMIVCGLANGVVNLFVMILSNSMPASLMFPLISAGGIILTAIISKTIYKEKLTIQQSVGLICGIVSVIFLNL